MKQKSIPLRHRLQDDWRRWRLRGKTRYFCIGRNKTGTTSLKVAFEQLGFVVGRQRTAKLLADEDYFAGRFDRILRYCETAEVFQDAPFSYPDTYREVDRAFPGSKFILTVRDNPEQWYQSLVSFHAKRFGRNGKPPTIDDIRALESGGDIQGMSINFMKVHGTPENDLYNREITIAHYEKFNREVMDYFRNRPEDLLVINVAVPEDYQRFLHFIGVASGEDGFPWANRTSEGRRG